MTPAEVDDILANADDFRLCDQVFGAAADLTDNKFDFDAESEPLRTVTLLWGT